MIARTKVEVKLAKIAPTAQLPVYGSSHAAGADLHACLSEPIEILPGAYTKVPTGVAIALPEGFEAQVRPRSGLAAKHGLTVLNAPGTIDADYRGEISVLLINHGPNAVNINMGDRIAQLVVTPYTHAEFSLVEDARALGKTSRGSGGFGSTGLKGPPGAR